MFLTSIQGQSPAGPCQRRPGRCRATSAHSCAGTCSGRCFSCPTRLRSVTVWGRTWPTSSTRWEASAAWCCLGDHRGRRPGRVAHDHKDRQA